MTATEETLKRGQVVFDLVPIHDLTEPGLHLVINVFVHQGNRIGRYGRGVWPWGLCYVNGFS